jgi:hypothetical protein
MSDFVSVVPWGLHPLPQWLLSEFARRAKEYDQSPTKIGEEKQYSGPRTAWVRFFSNGVSKHPDAVVPGSDGKQSKFEGFVMGGVHGFDNSYGFSGDDKVTIGVDAKGKPHKVSIDTATFSNPAPGVSAVKPDLPHRPPPTVTSISCELNGAGNGFPNTCRKITINWKCNSLAQLNYLIPYFLTPRITCLVEWGWNNYDNISLVDLTDLNWMNKVFTDPAFTLEWIKRSNGNYDVGMGFITDYGYTMTEDGGYECFTTITNANRLLEGEQVHTRQVTEKRGDDKVPVKGFKEFVKKNLESIDSNKPEYVDLRRKYKLSGSGSEAEERSFKDKVFRITKDKSSKNKKERMWIRLDLVQDVINAFFQIRMEGQKEATIRQFDISKTIISANPLLKSANERLLVPNQFAPRYAYEEPSQQQNNDARVSTEFNQYNTLFKSRIDAIKKQYPRMNSKFDNLKEVINKNGNSFPIYSNSGYYEAGYYGYLKDLFLDVKYFIKLVDDNDSVLKMIEQMLQGINDAMSQICQLKLVPAQYSNSVYSVIDDNLSGISSSSQAGRLTKISLGSLSSAFLRSVKLDVKVSQEMMNMLVAQSGLPDQDKDGSTEISNVTGKPIVSRYSIGDRLYRKGELITKSDSVEAPNISPAEEERRKKAKTAAEEAAAKEQEKELKKKEKLRDEKNEDTFLIYYENPDKKYYICEKTPDFMKYVLRLPDKSATYQNNQILPSTKITLEFLGISGIDYLSQFTLDHAPEGYNYSDAVWQVEDVRQEVSDKMWITTIQAGVRPLTSI